MPAKKKKIAKKAVRKTKLDDESKTYAFLATLLTIVGFILALLIKKDDKYVMFYAKQSLILFIGAIVVVILGFIPIVGWILGVLWVVLWVFSWIYALSGEEKEVPLIGQFARNINL